MNQYQTTIGLEIHVQLKTASKMFCGDSAAYFGAPPNSHVCPVCLGLPGALPVINEKAIESAIKFGLAINCKIIKESKFDRKNYFYPDLPKGYQISQFDLPIAYNGWVSLGEKKIRIERAHQEEDTGKLIHIKVDSKFVSLVDFNRSGVPLMEVVSEPDIESPEEAKNYAKKIHQIARYLDIADVSMEKAGMRFDANVSVRKKREKKLGTKVEIKNINSFRFLEKALAFEIRRQIEARENGEKIVQETRGWVESKGVTEPQRKKETSPDYRYFPEPDLTPLDLHKLDIRTLKKTLPELPDQVEKRFEESYGLDKKTVRILIEDKKNAQWYEKALSIYAKVKERKGKKAKYLANWIVGDIAALLKERKIDINDLRIEPAGFVELLKFIDDGLISKTVGKKVLVLMLETGNIPSKIVEDEGMAQISGKGELESIIKEITNENQKAVGDFRKGKEASLGFLVGQVMRKSGGKANPKIVNKMLREGLLDGNSNKS